MSLRLTRRAALVSSVAGAAALPSTGRAQAAANDSASLADQVDAYVKRVMAGFPDQPAVSVALVKDGQALMTRGYGVRSIGGAAVDEHTLFAIASNTKAVTCAALAILIDEGKVKWDEPVRTYLPGFSLSKPALNDMVTVRDLVSHRIGFGLGAGDLLFWPNSDRTRAEIMAAVPHVPIEDSFRTTYHYCNLMFVVAGGFVTTPVDWARWIAVQLARGELPDGTRLYSEARANEMWRPNIIISNSAGPTETLPGRAIASTYATGWQVQDYRGERMITHGGGAPGYVSGTVLIPGRNAGFSYFTNAEESFLTRALRSGITDIVMGKTGFDWVADGVRLKAEGDAKSIEAAAAIDAKQAAGAPPSLPLAAYAGTWRDPWYGDITIQARDLQLWLSFNRTPSLQGPVEPYDGDTLRTRFTDRREEDVFISFRLENGRPVSATMKAVSPDADFSYDYHNLRLTKV